MNAPERLETARLILRRTEVGDAEAIFERYATEPEVTRHLSWKPHARLEETRGFLASRHARWEAGDGFAWSILPKPDDGLDSGPIGMIDLSADTRQVEAGYVLAKPYWGLGYMTEALIAIRDLAFSSPDVHRFQIVCEVDNPASARVMEKAGFEREGILRRYITNPNVGGVPRDCLCYSYVRPDTP